MNTPIATAARRLTPLQRIAVLLMLIILADFSIPDGCDCGPSEFRTTATTQVR